MDNRLGIDFGTTNYRVALRRGERFEVLPTPDDGRDLRVRLAGPPSSRLKAALAAHSPLPFGGGLQPAVEAAAQILRHLGAAARRALGGELEGVVVTVPAAAGNVQRAGIRQAAELAGLGGVRLLNEPTAAAIGYTPKDAARLLLIYALGAGPLEVAVLEVKGDHYDALAVESDPAIGGDVFDHRIAQYFLRQVRAQYHIDLSHSADAARWLELEHAAEAAKIKLDKSASTSLPLRPLRLRGDRREVNVRLELDREELEGMLQPEIERSVQVARAALAAAHRTPDAIDEVLLVGGSTRMPLIGQCLGAAFGRPVVQGADDLAALGAAAFALMLPADQLGRPQPAAAAPAAAGPAASPDPLPAAVRAAVDGANALLAQNDAKGAVARLDSLRPRDVPPGEPLRCVLACYITAADGLLAAQRHADAIRTLEQARTFDKRAPDLTARLAAAYQAAAEDALHRHAPETAIDLIRRSRVSGAGGSWSAPLLAAAYRLRGLEAAAKRQWRPAGEAFGEALRLAPNDAAATAGYVDATLQLAEELCRSGRANGYQQAADKLKQACKTVPADKRLAEKLKQVQAGLSATRRSSRRS